MMKEVLFAPFSSLIIFVLHKTIKRSNKRVHNVYNLNPNNAKNALLLQIKIHILRSLKEQNIL